MFQRAPLPSLADAYTPGVGGNGADDWGAHPSKRGRPSSSESLSPAERAKRYRAAKSARTETAIQTVTENLATVTKIPLSSLEVCAPSPAAAASGISVTQNRYGPVTRTETAKSGQIPVTKTQITESLSSALDLSCPIGLEVFCDWITIYQDHQIDLPILNDGFVVRFEPDAFRKSIDSETGEIRPMFDAMKAEYTVSRKMEHEGSYESKVAIRCDGRRVELSGNVGRFGRPDNVFGLSVLETIDRANEILASLDLPPFSCVERNCAFARVDSFSKGNNAVITRTDLTANFATGSRANAFRVLHWMSGQGTARNSGKNPRNYGNGVTWNEGSKRHYEKLYFKADELGPHVTPEVRDYCEQNGILRYEVSLKARELADRGLQSMMGWLPVTEDGMRKENVIYGHFAQVLTRNQVSVTECQKIPGKLGFIARSYLNGENPYESAEVPDRTRRRWRSDLMKFGLDIAQPIDVTRLNTRIRMIDLQPVAAPAWYNRRAA